MRLWVVPLLCSLPAFCGNEVILTDTTGSAQTSRPFTVSRVFTKAEFPSGTYPRPSVSGTPLTQWQTNIRSTWPDGSVKHALITFHQSLTSNGAATVTFVGDSNPCHLGNQAACDAAAPTQSQILSFNSSAWGASIETTQASATQVTNARTMVGAGAWRFWIKGPLVAVVVTEDRSTTLAYDYGYTWNSGSATWSVASTAPQKSLHPYFVITQYKTAAGGDWPGVKVEYMLEAPWATKLQSQVYNVSLKSGSALTTTKYTKSAFTHLIASRWRKVFWDGTAPGAIKVDFNLPYMIASKMLPNFDLSHGVGASAVALEVATYNSTDKCDLGGNGIFLTDMSGTGGRPEIGYIDRWSVRWLYSMDPTLFDIMLGYAQCGGLISGVHIRESDNTRWFDSGHTVNAFGHVLSIDARPGASIYDAPDSGFSDSADRLTVVGLRVTTPWNAEMAHQPNFSFLPYLVTGDMYWLDEMWFWGSWDLAKGTVDDTSRGSRHHDWGYINHSIAEVRGQAWAERNLMHAAWMSPDTQPEAAYFTEKLNNNIAIREGTFNITTGAFYDPDPASKWSWGRWLLYYTPNPLHMFGRTGNIVDADVDTTKACSDDAPWMFNFNHMVWGIMDELGFTQIHGLRTAVASNLLGQLLDPGYNPYVSAFYRIPATAKYSGSCAGNETTAPYGGIWNGPFFTTWTAVLDAQRADYVAASVSAFNASATDPEHGYANILRAATAMLNGITSDGYNGTDAWTWVYPKTDVIQLGASTANCTASGRDVTTCDNPRWALLPRAVTATSNKKHAGKFSVGGAVRF